MLPITFESGLGKSKLEDNTPDHVLAGILNMPIEIMEEVLSSSLARPRYHWHDLTVRPLGRSHRTAIRVASLAYHELAR